MPQRKKKQSEICRGVSVSMSKDDEKVVEFVCDHDEMSLAKRVREFFKNRQDEILEE